MLPLSLAFAAQSARADDDEMGVARTGLGWETCRTYLMTVERDADYRGLYSAWLAGFLTVAAREMDDAGGFENEKTIVAAEEWVDRYCRRKPDDTYVAAAVRLISAHAMGRIASD